MFTTTARRVQQNTAKETNARIRHHTEQYAMDCLRGGPAAIDRRLAELDEEWDIERCLETMAPTFSLAGLALGVTANRKWLAVPIVVQAFFLQHALQGWCPPIPVLRRLGFRTADEINEERYALKALRGDFDSLSALPKTSGTSRVREAFAAAEA
ncbi:MAG TPA: hypothetical protein VFW73_02565 [Lacipirellulaceae bacterium]|nr:hypothetical protein [Lacipirellulaceae bacterium]